MRTNVKLLAKRTIASGTMAFHFAKPEGFRFRAGQYGTYTLIDPPETDAEGTMRKISFAQAPCEPELIAALRMRDTAFKRVLRDLPIGAEVTLDAPHGDFSLHKTTSKPAVFLIGGIGVTPVRSMIVQATHEKTDHSITLLHAARVEPELPFRSDFTALAQQNPNFRYIMTVEEPAADWRGERGRVTAAMVRKYVPDLTRPMYYLCGPEGMVKAMRTLLVTLGVDEDNIRTEEFTGY